MKLSLENQVVRHRSTTVRKGLAPLELALALPILMVMMSLIFGVCSATHARMNATQAARNAAFAKRHTPWKHDAQTLTLPDLQKVSRILGPSPIMPAGGGMVSGEGADVPTHMFGPLSDVLLSTSCERFVLGGGWDFQEVEFKKHKALILTDKAKYFGVRSNDIDAFKSLGGFGAGFGGNAGSSMGQVQQALQSAQQDITARLNEIQTQLRQLNNQLKQQKQSLANLRSNPSSTPASIRHAEQQVKSTQSKIDTLKSEQGQQHRAQDSLGVTSSLPGQADVAASEENS